MTRTETDKAITASYQMAAGHQEEDRRREGAVGTAVAEIDTGFKFRRNTPITRKGIAGWLLVTDVKIATDTGCMVLKRSTIIADPSTARDIAGSHSDTRWHPSLQPLTESEKMRLEQSIAGHDPTLESTIAGMGVELAYKLGMPRERLAPLVY